MNIAIINDSAIFTGIGRYATYLTYATNAVLFSLKLDSTIRTRKYPGIEVFPRTFPKIGTGWYLNHRFPSVFLSNIKKQIEKQINPNTIIHYSSQNVPRINLKNRYVFTIHDTFGLDPNFCSNSRVRKINEMNLRYSASSERIISVSKFTQSQLKKFGMEGNIDVIYPPVATAFKPLEKRESLRKKLGLPENKKLVLSVSTQNPRKNLKAVAETMKFLGSEYNLVRVGHPIDQSYSFTNVGDEELNMIYNACDVLLFPSLEEGFGSPIAESMTVGLPVVASDIPIFNEVAENSALLVEPKPEKLAKGIREVLDNKDIFRDRGIQIAKRYSFDCFKENIIKFYKKIM